ncbi:hypothetical protein EKO04_001312 [Ascochyta lentis]|uniref:Uncharacterized protein n=1 Tax=Ascochyta lentis TaxID=205686 RepID=A0A8H7JAV6_9PLEO|nr:hypothetical protein EKO04_001312 [Ascochyta lentis]
MPGAQRSVRAAITDLGNIPVLRPQPQQAIIAHVDDESDDANETLGGPTQSLGSPSNLTTGPTQPVHLGAALATASIPVLYHSTRLPLRLGRPHRRLGTDPDASSSPKEQSDDSGSAFVEPAGSPMEATNAPAPATPGRRRANEEVTVDSSPARQPNPPTSPAGLRGGASHPQRSRVRSVGQDIPHAPSPLRQTQTRSSARQSDESSSDSDGEYPVIHIQGYFDFKRNSGVDYTYNFREVFPNAPQTEPFRRISQPRFHTRSQSSNDASAPHFVTPTSNIQDTSRGDDVFWTASAPATERHGNSGRPRLQSSEMSNTSLAYSYYELPENRQSSGEYTAPGRIWQSQYDGMAASRQASRGTYRSVRLSDAQALNNSVPRPPTPNTSSFTPPIPAFVGQWGTSPLPAEPYTRTGNTGNRLQPATRRATQDDPGRASHSNAVAAAVENRLSPLDALTTQYGRASQSLAGQQREPQRRQGSAYYITHFGPYPYSPPMAMADDPYTLGATAHAGQLHIVPTTRLVSAQPTPVFNHHGPPNYHGPNYHGSPNHHDIPNHQPTYPGPSAYPVLPLPRTMQAVRSGQRSSENAPVGPSTQDGHVARNAQVREQVSAFEQMQNAAQPRQTRQPQAVPRQRTDLPSSPMPPAPPMAPSQHAVRHPVALSPGHGNIGRRSVRMDPRLQDQENSGEAETEMMRQEFQAVRTRYDADQHGEVMDETPPRIGRVERHL